MSDAPGLPLLLIDVDGPLNPYGNSNNQLRKGKEFRLHKLHGFKVWLNRWHGEQLLKLADAFELVWCTTWEHDANALIGPRIGLPDLPVIEFDKTWHLPSRGDGTYFKTHEVVEYAAGRSFAWVDDEITAYDEQYVTEHHDGHAKLLQISPVEGLRQPDFDTLAAWAAALEVDAQPAGGP